MAYATPYDLYIRYLATQGTYDINVVNEELDSLSLLHISQEQLDNQCKVIERSVPPRVMKVIDSGKPVGEDFLKWMKVLEVKELWQTVKPYIVADTKKRVNLLMGLLPDRVFALTLNALLIKNCPPRDICDGVNAKFSGMLQPEHIEIYRKFFFDPRRMTRKDWKLFLSKTESKERNTYFVALTEDIDIVKNELELPTNISTTVPLQFLMINCYKKAKQYLEVSTKESNAEARAWISQFTSLVDKYEKYKTGDKADFAKQLQLEFDYIDAPFPTADADILAQLSADIMDRKEEEPT